MTTSSTRAHGHIGRFRAREFGARGGGGAQLAARGGARVVGASAPTCDGALAGPWLGRGGMFADTWCAGALEAMGPAGQQRGQFERTWWRVAQVVAPRRV